MKKSLSLYLLIPALLLAAIGAYSYTAGVTDAQYETQHNWQFSLADDEAAGAGPAMSVAGKKSLKLQVFSGAAAIGSSTKTIGATAGVNFWLEGTVATASDYIQYVTIPTTLTATQGAATAAATSIATSTSALSTTVSATAATYNEIRSATEAGLIEAATGTVTITGTDTGTGNGASTETTTETITYTHEINTLSDSAISSFGVYSYDVDGFANVKFVYHENDEDVEVAVGTN